MSADNKISPELPVGTRLLEESEVLYLNCLVCGVNLGIYMAQTATSEHIENKAHNHIREGVHTRKVREISERTEKDLLH